MQFLCGSVSSVVQLCQWSLVCVCRCSRPCQGNAAVKWSLWDRHVSYCSSFRGVSFQAFAGEDMAYILCLAWGWLLSLFRALTLSWHHAQLLRPHRRWLSMDNLFMPKSILWNLKCPNGMLNVIDIEDFLLRRICQNEFLASRTEDSVAPDICVATSSILHMGCQGLFSAVLRSFGLIHSLIAALSFLCAATMEDTLSVGSVTGVMTPRYCRWSSSALTGMRWAGQTTGWTLGSTIMEYVTGSSPSSSLSLVLCGDLCVKVCVTVHSDLVHICTHFDNSHFHTCMKS